jgi:hypothetical protein
MKEIFVDIALTSTLVIVASVLFSLAITDSRDPPRWLSYLVATLIVVITISIIGALWS